MGHGNETALKIFCINRFGHRFSMVLDLQSLFGLLCTAAEPVFLKVYEALESIPRNEFRQPM
jgi:hypothetical protein